MLASKHGTIIIAGMATVIAMMAAALLVPYLQQQNALAQQQQSPTDCEAVVVAFPVPVMFPPPVAGAVALLPSIGDGWPKLLVGIVMRSNIADVVMAAPI